jgi:hypothetical protein
MTLPFTLPQGSPRLPSTPQFDLRGILWMMDSAHTGPRLSQWLRWASESGSTPSFVRTVAEAALIACIPDYLLLRPLLVELKRRYPGPEPGKPPNFTPRHDAPRQSRCGFDLTS